MHSYLESKLVKQNLAALFHRQKLQLIQCFGRRYPVHDFVRNLTSGLAFISTRDTAQPHEIFACVHYRTIRYANLLRNSITRATVDKQTIKVKNLKIVSRSNSQMMKLMMKFN